MNITLTIQEADYGFVVEAIKLRTTSMLESFDLQVDSQRLASMSKVELEKAKHEVHVEVQKEFDKTLAEWKIATDGNKVSATRKPRKIDAPYGVKKDGTPKKKPGRQAGF
jgi:hypothetical protein